MTPSDTALIEQAQQGTAAERTAAFEHLVHRYDKRVLALAMSYTHNEEDAKDIYQEVFIRVHRSLPKFEQRSEFMTWLYRIVTNVCLTHRSQVKARAEINVRGDESFFESALSLSGFSGGDAPGASNTSGRFGAETAVNMSLQIQEAMQTLSPQQRMTFTLKHFEGYKIREIAEMLGIAEGTIKKYLFTATERLREQLKDISRP